MPENTFKSFAVLGAGTLGLPLAQVGGGGTTQCFALT